MEKTIYTWIVISILSMSLFACTTKKDTATEKTSPKSSVHRIPTQKTPSALSSKTTTEEWDTLQHKKRSTLVSELSKTTDSNRIAWLKLAIISKKFSTHTTALIHELIAWRKEYPTHPANALFPEDKQLASLLKTPSSRHIALLLPLQGPLKRQGQAIRDGFLSAYYDSLANHKQEQTITFIDTSQDNSIASYYQQAVRAGADLVIGPLTKKNVEQLITINDYPVTTLALNYTDLADHSLPTNFYQFGLSQKDEAEQLAIKALEVGYSQALIIAENSASAEQIIKPLITQWQSDGGKIIDTYYYSLRSNFYNDIADLLHTTRPSGLINANKQNEEALPRRDFDVIFLLAAPTQARIVVPLLQQYYENIPIFSSSLVDAGIPSPQKNADLNGVIFPDIPWLLNNPLKSPSSRLYAVGRDAQLLSTSLQRLLILPHFPIYGATGALSFNSKQQIYRRVPWTQIHAGNPS